MILPYMDQSAVYDMLNFGAADQGCTTSPAYFVLANRSATVKSIGAFMCPSDPDAQPIFDYASNITSPKGTSSPNNYCATAYPAWTFANNSIGFGGVTLPGNIQSGTVQYWLDPLLDASLSRFRHDIRKHGTIADGTSRTLFALEVRSKVKYNESSDTNGGVGVVSTWFVNTPLSWIVYADCAYFDAAAPYFYAPITMPIYGLNLVLQKPNPLWPLWIGAGSYHPGGANGLKYDGSVDFISNNQDFRVLAASISIATGETTGQL